MADTDSKAPDEVDPTQTKEFQDLLKKTKRSTHTAAARPVLTVYGMDGKPSKRRIHLPDVFLTPIRADLVRFVHSQLKLNRRQPYGVLNQEGPHGLRAGHEVAAKSWGTGRAVSRVPRVKGGGTHRAGQGAYAGMCRGGMMWSPTKIWRRWHRKVNKNQKRYAVCSALAASAVPALVAARGHRIDNVAEIPLVLENDFQKPRKTRVVKYCLRELKLFGELRRCNKRYMRAGKGKMRNRRWRRRTGPLIVYAKNNGIVEASRNIPGVDSCSVYKLNLLKLAPGGHLGRFIIWTEAAIECLNNVYGTNTRMAVFKNNYRPPRPIMKNSDFRRIIMSQEIQSVLRPTKTTKKFLRKKNPLKRPHVMAKLNPDFAEEFHAMRKEKGKEAKYWNPNTMDVVEKIKKKRKLDRQPFVGINLKLADKKRNPAYWQNVFGDDKTFKTAKLLAAEKKAVAEAIRAQEREKAGVELMELLAAENAKAAADDDDS